MLLTFTATYENGVLRPSEPLPMVNGTKYRIVADPCVQPNARDANPDHKDVPIPSGTGIPCWIGDRETLWAIAEEVQRRIVQGRWPRKDVDADGEIQRREAPQILGGEDERAAVPNAKLDIRAHIQS